MNKGARKVRPPGRSSADEGYAYNAAPEARAPGREPEVPLGRPRHAADADTTEFLNAKRQIRAALTRKEHHQ